MKKSYLRILYLPLVVVLSACSSDLATEKQNPIFSMTGDDEPVPVAFSVSAQHTGDFTRTTESIVTFTNGEAVKVCVSTDGGSNYTGYDFTAAATGQNVDLNAPSGNAAKPYVPPGSTSSVKAYAYYPSTAAASTFSVADNQTTPEGYKASDLMYAAVQTITKPTTSATLSMAHKMVQLNITASAQDGSGLTVKRVLVNGKKSVTFTPATGAASTTGSNGDIIAYSNGTGAATTGAQYILIPVQQISNVSIKVETGGEGVAATTATFNFTSTDEFAAGNSYPISLTVGTSQLGGTTTIANWNGQQSVTVTGTKELHFGDIDALDYTGSPLTPNFTIYDANNTQVATQDNASTYFDIYWQNNINAGTASVIAVGKTDTDYAGLGCAKDFTINKVACSVNLSATNLEIENGSTGTFTVTRSGDGDITATSDNESFATTSVDQSTGVVTVTGNNIGSATITVKVNEGTNHYAYTATNKTVSVSILRPELQVCDVSAVTSSNTEYLGYVICSNGHVHTTANPNCGGSASAMIVYVGDAGTADASSSTTYKGLAIALSDAKDGSTTRFEWYTADSGTCVYQRNDFNAHYGYADMKGIDNTNKLANKTGTCSGHTHAAAVAARDYNNTVAVPANCSQWFLPTSGQWFKFFRNSKLNLSWTNWWYSSGSGSDFTKVNKMFTDAGASGAVFSNSMYWSSSEFATNLAVDVGFSSSDGVYVYCSKKSGTRGVRAFLAF